MKHCIDFLVDRMKQTRRKFYIGITHCPHFRWTNQGDVMGHKWDRYHNYKVMYVLLKCRGVDRARQVEKELVDLIHEGGIKLTTGTPLSQLIINVQKTPPGALFEGPHAESHLYVLFC
jgi:hypothetical protein